MKTLRFLKKVNPRTILISGGEPTLVPNIMHIIRRLNFEFPESEIILATNGTFWDNNFLLDKLLNLNGDITVQVTHDVRYYPQYVNLKKLREFYIVTRLQKIFSVGRAKDNRIADNDRRIPFCYNMRLLLRNGFDFIKANTIREYNEKFCSWGITPKGQIILSESLLCPPVGNVADSLEVIEDNIRNFSCANCTYAKNMMELKPRRTSALT